MVESFKPEYKGNRKKGGIRRLGGGCIAREDSNGKIKTETIVAQCSFVRKDAVGLVETNEGSSNSKRKRMRERRKMRKNKGKGEGRE